MARYILLLHDSPTDFAGVSPEEMQKIIDEYSAWRERLAEQGRLAGGEKLEDGTARHLTRVDGRLQVLDGPFAEAKEVLGGFFMIAADSYDQAVEISSDCPHLAYGGRIELRALDEIHP